MNISLKRLALLCAVVGAMFASTASAAVKWSDVFDGNYFSPSADGRGISVLSAPQADGSTLFFGALFTYDENNEPVWLILFAPFLEHQFENTDVQILQFTGGEFSGDFDPAMGTRVGTAHVRLDSCNALYVDLDMDDSSGFPDSNLGVLQPVDGPGTTCVYQKEFTGCPSFATENPIVPRGCNLTGVYNQDIALTNEITWILDGLVRIGDDNANSATIWIEPGTILIGAGQTADYLYISPGSQIYANGTASAPIVLTSPQDGFISGTTPLPGDLGGLVVSGNAPVNACPEAPFNCFSEFDQSQRFGGDNPNESSGSITYFQVRYAGIEFQPDAEVNSFTFQGVGAGTTVKFIQAFRGQDDGVEFFGGNVRVRFVIVTEGGDDAIDWDLGYFGKLQFGLVIHGEGFGEDFGVEGASNPDNFDALQRATPSVANFTFLGNGNGDSGLLHKDGSGGIFYNTIVDGFPTSCIEWADAPATYDAAGTPEAPNTDVAAFNGVIINCGVSFLDDDGAPFAVGDFFGSSAFTGNEDANPQLDGYQPRENSRSLSGSVPIPDDAWFEQTFYRGAFDGQSDWTGFGHQVSGGQ